MIRLYLITTIAITALALAQSPVLSPDLCLPYQARIAQLQQETTEWAATVFEQEDTILRLEKENRELRRQLRSR